MGSKQPLKSGEKILFGIFGVFIILAVVGYIALEIVRQGRDKPMFESKTTYVFDELGQQGSAVFRHAQCTSCHRAMRNGTNMGLDLDGIGSQRTFDELVAFLKEPEKNYPAATIDHGAAPKEAAYVAKMTDVEIRSLAAFLSGLRAETGSSAARKPPEEESGFIDNMVRIWAPKSWASRFQDVRDPESTAPVAPVTPKP
ncbi:MAG: cytochrome c [Gammaproteobacteria bacterium]|nr:cytochrome c [Gammaproteobacteria bacterium]